MPATGEFLNNNIVKLDLFCMGSKISSATGVIIDFDSTSFIMTNWHVLSGRDPNSGQPINQDLATPDKLAFYSLDQVDGNFRWRITELPIISPQDGSNLWIQHPKYRQEVDIAAIALPQGTRPKYAKNIFDRTGHDSDMLIDLGSDLFLPGFPLGFAANGFQAIWKRASLASSLEYGAGVDKYFYVDTASRSGMSGLREI